MSVIQNLSALAVRSLFEGFCSSIGFPAGPAAADAATKFLGSSFSDHSQKVGARSLSVVTKVTEGSRTTSIVHVR